MIKCDEDHKNGFAMIKIFLSLVLMQSVAVQADVKHQIRFCAGKFCATASPLTISQQLEINQQFVEGNLIDKPAYAKATYQTPKQKIEKQVSATASLGKNGLKI